MRWRTAVIGVAGLLTASVALAQEKQSKPAESSTTEPSLSGTNVEAGSSSSAPSEYEPETEWNSTGMFVGGVVAVYYSPDVYTIESDTKYCTALFYSVLSHLRTHRC